MMSEKQWIVNSKQKIGRLEGIPWRVTWDNYGIFSIQGLDRQLKLFVPALFSKIEITDNKIVVKVPYQVAPRLVKHLRDCYYMFIPLEVIGV